MASFATVDDFYAYQGKPTPELDDAERLEVQASLERASDRIRPALRLAKYRRRADGLPAAESQRSAIVRATCAQAVAFDRDGEDGGFDSVSMAGVTLTKRSTVTSTRGASRIDAAALEILAGASLYTTAVGSKR